MNWRRRTRIERGTLAALWALLALAVVGSSAYLLARGHSERASTRTLTQTVTRRVASGVLGARHTRVQRLAAAQRSRRSAARVVRVTARSAVPVLGRRRLTRYAGRPVVARNARVLSVVGWHVFWIGSGGTHRLLVYLDRRHASKRRVHRGDRVSFVGRIVRNPRWAASRWGITRREWSGLLGRQAVHARTSARGIRIR